MRLVGITPCCAAAVILLAAVVVGVRSNVVEDQEALRLTVNGSKLLEPVHNRPIRLTGAYPHNTLT